MNNEFNIKISCMIFTFTNIEKLNILNVPENRFVSTYYKSSHIYFKPFIQ